MANASRIGGGTFELIDERQHRRAGGDGHGDASYRTSYGTSGMAAPVRIRRYGLRVWIRGFGRERTFGAVRAASRPCMIAPLAERGDTRCLDAPARESATHHGRRVSNASPQSVSPEILGASHETERASSACDWPANPVIREHCVGHAQCTPATPIPRRLRRDSTGLASRVGVSVVLTARPARAGGPGAGNSRPGGKSERTMDGAATETKPPNRLAPSRYMSVRTCATYLDRTTKAIYHLIADGRIPYRKLPGGRIVFDRDAIDRWIAGAPGVSVGEARRTG